MKPYPHQKTISVRAFEILRSYGIVYLAMEERTGKTLISLICAEEYAKLNNKKLDVIVFTKKQAVKGWLDTINSCDWLSNNYTITNYPSCYKYDSFKYNLVILDESHNYLSAFPKVTEIWKEVAFFCAQRPIIYISATPCAQGYHLLYNQLKLSSNSPWKDIKDPYHWIKQFPNPRSYNKYRFFNKLETSNEEIWKSCRHLFIKKTRKQLQFMQEPQDVVHYVELNKTTRKAYNVLLHQRLLNFLVVERQYKLVADTGMKLRTSLHMLEGGVAKVNNEHVILGNEEKIDFIKKMWGDNKNLVIMYNYVAEGKKLQKHFSKAAILQGTSHAEGVDLSGYKDLVIYSQNFSVAKHTQRRARQINKLREQEIKVNFLLAKQAISEQVYETVSVKKTNFVDKLFDEVSI